MFLEDNFNIDLNTSDTEDSNQSILHYTKNLKTFADEKQGRKSGELSMKR